MENSPVRRQLVSCSVGTQSGINCHLEQRHLMMSNEMSLLLGNANNCRGKEWREMVYSNYGIHRNCLDYAE